MGKIMAVRGMKFATLTSLDVSFLFFRHYRSWHGVRIATCWPWPESVLESVRVSLNQILALGLVVPATLISI